MTAEEVELSLRMPLTLVLIEELLGMPLTTCIQEEAKSGTGGHFCFVNIPSMLDINEQRLPDQHRETLKQHLYVNIQCLSTILKEGLLEVAYPSCGAWFIFLFRASVHFNLYPHKGWTASRFIAQVCRYPLYVNCLNCMAFSSVLANIMSSEMYFNIFST